jgi:hypothetical protein
MTGGSGMIIRRPSVAESLRILLDEADCDGALGVVELALPPVSLGRRCTYIPRTRRPSTYSPVNGPCRLARRSLPVVLAPGHAPGRQRARLQHLRGGDTFLIAKHVLLERLSDQAFGESCR